MATLTPTTDLSLPLTRQDLLNMWKDAAMGTIARDDLAPGVFAFDTATHLTSATNTPSPGHGFWAQAEALMYIFHDEVDDTAVSLWLAVGPDRFDTACLAAEPIPAGAVVEPWFDRWVRVATEASDPVAAISIGCNQSGVDFDDLNNGSTAASGTWIPVAIDGIPWGYVQNTALDINRLCRVSSTSPGALERSSSLNQHPDVADDPIGFSYQGATAGDTMANVRFIWMGHRLFRAFPIS